MSEERTPGAAEQPRAPERPVIEPLAADLHTAERRAGADAQHGQRVLRADVLARMGHELRAPLNAIIGFIRLVEEGLHSTEEERRDFLGSARTSALSMLDLINNILDLARIESGPLSLQSAEFSVAELAEEVAKSLAPDAHAKGLEIDALVDPALPPRLKGDPVRLRQVLINLAGNAIKFTDEGMVLLRVQQEPSTADASHVRFSVRDTGSGVTPEQQKTIFDTFAQSRPLDVQRRGGGLGLGLSISRQIVEQMGGKLEVQSEPGQGSTFSFAAALPRGRQFGIGRRDRPPHLGGSVVLLLDPRPEMAILVSEKLARHDAVVVHAADAQAALAMLARTQRTASPVRTVLVDQRVSTADATAFARQVRAETAWYQPQLVHLSIVGAAADAGELRGVGYEPLLVKPVLADALASTLGGLLARHGASGVPREGEDPAARALARRARGRFGRVLVAEDNPVTQRLLHALLTQQGQATLLVANGHEAVAAFKEQPFDLVLMDVQMPVMDGLAATRAIRDLPSGRSVPIVALTADAVEGERERCLAAGMSDWLAKPIMPDVLGQKVGDWLAPAEIEPRSVREPLLDEAHLDAVRAYVRESDPARFVAWVNLFRAEARDALDALALATSRGDREGVRAAARGLALASGGFGAQRLRALAEQVAQEGEADGAEPEPRTLAGLQATWREVESQLGARYASLASAPAAS